MTTKASTIAKLAEELGVKKTQAAAIYDAVASVVLDDVRESSVAILPGLGRVKAVVRPARKARNPKTGGVIDVPQRTVLKLVTSKEAKERFAA